MTLRLPIALSLFLFASIAGVLVVVYPVMLGIIAGITALLLTGVYIFLKPKAALFGSPFLVLLAATKFRMRDPHELLSGNFDGQVFLELTLYGIIALIAVLNLFSKPVTSTRLTVTELSLLSYVILLLLSVYWSYDARFTVVRGIQLLILNLLCLTSVRFLGPAKLMHSLTISAVLYIMLFSSLAILFPWADGTRPSHGVTRFSWFALHPIIAATIVSAATLLLIVEGLFAPNGWHRRILGVPLLLLVPTLISILLAIHCRGPLGAFLLAAFVLLIAKYTGLQMGGILFSSAIFLISVIVINFGDYSSLHHGGFLVSEENAPVAFLLRGQTTDEFASASGRVDLWRLAYDLFLARPFFGYGYLAPRPFLIKYFSWAGEAHNGVLSSLLNIGIIGSIPLWFAFWKTLLSSLATVSLPNGSPVWQRASILGVLLFLMVQSVFEESFAGIPSFDVFLFFTLVSAYGKL